MSSAWMGDGVMGVSGSAGMGPPWLRHFLYYTLDFLIYHNCIQYHCRHCWLVLPFVAGYPILFIPIDG